MVLILLSTFNGDRYIEAFLHSLQKQSYTQWHLLVRDDASSDATRSIVDHCFEHSPKQYTWIASDENIGAKESFNILMKAALHRHEYEYIMFADQDDVWKPTKIEQTLHRMRHLQERYATKPLLVHTDLHVSDAGLEIMDPSLWHYEQNNPQKTTLNYLLYQNTATGCTMMLNRVLLELAYPVAKGAIMHDWWCSMVAAVFGEIGIVDDATLLYRQHQSNSIGAKQSQRYDLFIKLLNIVMLRNEPYLRHLEPHRKQAAAFLEHFSEQLSTEHKELLEFFIAMPTLSWRQKRRGIITYRCLRQGWVQNIGLLMRV